MIKFVERETPPAPSREERAREKAYSTLNYVLGEDFHGQGVEFVTRVLLEWEAAALEQAAQEAEGQRPVAPGTLGDWGAGAVSTANKIAAKIRALGGKP